MVKRSWSVAQQADGSQNGSNGHSAQPEQHRRLSVSSTASATNTMNLQRSPDDAQSPGKDNSPPSVVSNGSRENSNSLNGSARGVPISKIIHTQQPVSAVNDEGELVSLTTRKSTACPACRKQKIKCIMENDLPPCKRCAKQGIFCSPNKTLQGILGDQARWNSRMRQNFARMESALNEARAALNLPSIFAMDESATADEEAQIRESSEFLKEGSGLEVVRGAGEDEVLDNVHSGPDNLASAPIRSLYEVTQANRGINGKFDRHQNGHNGGDSASGKQPDDLQLQASGLVIEPDFISRGVITLAEADQLAKVYLNRLDHFFYGYLQEYPDFSAVRARSTLLALTVCVVASQHDPLGSDVYDKLSRELRNLVSSLLFRPRLGFEDIKALCMGCYWLADITWMLTSLVVRKAVSMQYHMAHLSQPVTDIEGFKRSQLWLLIYLSNEQISILQGAPSGVGRDFVNWEAHMSSSFSSEADLRLVSHIDLLLIFSRARELFGLDTTKQIPRILIPQLRDFNMQVDRWGAAWSGKLARNKQLGNFPSEAIKIHWRFAKFYICSHAFRGLSVGPTSGTTSRNDDQSIPIINHNVTLSRDLEDIAAAAITTAFDTLHLLLESDELQSSLVGMPHYFHTMFAFAAVFLLKVATRYSLHVKVDIPAVLDISTRVVRVFRKAPCARQHLVSRIARGLSEMLERAQAQYTAAANAAAISRKASPAPSGAPGGSTSAEQAEDGIMIGAMMSQGQAGIEEYSIEAAMVENALNGALPQLDLENYDFLSSIPPSWSGEFDL
ncbi:hypothetical protein BZA70DRAFT_150599 [Myxozyma melibiosi]|uniref:Zn(2)-C6 fungal-type domain-containing protein n=1 Tax=Myxozyma melibiosi TaxID=54550 RepID=A0ABR1F856_9ASCO